MYCAIFLAHTALGPVPPAPLASELPLDMSDPSVDVSFQRVNSGAAGQQPPWDVRTAALDELGLKLQPPASPEAERAEGILSAFLQLRHGSLSPRRPHGQ